MTQAFATDLSNGLFSSFQPMLDLQNAILQGLMQAQQVQFQMLTAWQQPLAAVNQELWDQWISRFGGGVPLDG